MEILLINAAESMKRSKSKQLAGYIFAHCISLVPAMPDKMFVTKSINPVKLDWARKILYLFFWNGLISGRESGH